MPAYEIPLSAEAQKLDIALAGVTYKLRFVWNATSCCWILDVADADDNPLALGVPLVTGLDLLAQYAYLGIAGSLIVQTDNDTDAVPTYGNLGTAGRLYFVTE